MKSFADFPQALNPDCPFLWLKQQSSGNHTQLCGGNSLLNSSSVEPRSTAHQESVISPANPYFLCLYSL